MNAIDLVVPVMLVAGAVGGLINLFTTDGKDEKPLEWWKHLIIGVGAAFTVPVFLNMISSSLISEITGPISDAKVFSKLLVFMGFCLLGAFSSRAFLQSLSQRILQQAKNAVNEAGKARSEARTALQQSAEAKSAADVATEAVAPLIEDEIPGDAPQAAHDKVSHALSPEEQKVLAAMANGRYSLRSLSGLATDTGLPKPAVNETISRLLAKGLAAETANRQGQPRWHATTAGRMAVTTGG